MPDKKDILYMREALRLASAYKGLASPDPAVGAVVVKKGRIVGRGYHDKFSTPHAESFALKQAGRRASGATLYINLEPCCHYGNNPPCTDALIKAGIKRVVAAIRDPNPLVNGKGFKRLKKAGIKVESGLLEKEALEMNEFFIKYITTRQPFVILKAAMSLDGKIATKRGESFWITGKESRKYAHSIRSGVDAVMAGIGTILKDDPLLTARPSGKKPAKQPLRVIVDSRARTPLSSQVIKDKSALTLIAVTKAAPKRSVAKLLAAGAEVVTVKSKNNLADLKDLMKALGKRKVSSVLIEGGGRLLAGAVEAGIADKAIFFVAPKIIGGSGAPTPVEGKGVSDLQSALNLHCVSVKQLGHDIVIEGYFERR